MGFSISGGEGGWIGVLILLLGVPAALVAVWIFLTASKQARDEVVEDDPSGDGPIA